MAKRKQKIDTHTILLAQFTEHLNSRQYAEFKTLEEALEGLCRIFEGDLKKRFQNMKRIQYDVEDLLNFIKALPDLSCLVYDQSIRAYNPHGKDWILQQVVDHLREQARLASEAADRRQRR